MMQYTNCVVKTDEVQTVKLTLQILNTYRYPLWNKRVPLLSSVVNKDLTFKAKAKDLTSRTSSRTAFDRGVFECWI